MFAALMGWLDISPGFSYQRLIVPMQGKRVSVAVAALVGV